MRKKVRFKFLEHTADVYIAAYGSSLEEAFCNAALAMFEVMTDTQTVENKFVNDFEIEEVDKKALLYSWLEDLLIKFDIDGTLYSKFEINAIRQSNDKYLLKGKAWGESYRPGSHPSRTEVKAVTYHDMEILSGRERVTVKFILDV